MTKVGLIKFLICFFIAFSAQAQKVKYKDIFALLSTKQYDQAEPFLKKYLRDNDDNPNAYMFMGIIFQDKASRNDILKQTGLSLHNMDSAIFFYEKANKIIDEKEIKRNKEYYEAYSRRDLRTGDFGVKLSDVQFDLEKKKEAMHERIDKVKMINYYFHTADSLYAKSTRLYAVIQKPFTDERAYFLQSTPASIEQLKTLNVRFDSVMKFFDNYRASLQNLGSPGYNQKLQLMEIVDFKNDGTAPANFYENDIKIWDYKKWATTAIAVITKEIVPMREHLVAYDVELNKLRDKMNADSVSVRSDLTKLIDKLLYEQLRKFDDNPLPTQVFAAKIADMEYKSSLLEHKKMRDSMNVHLQLALALDEVARISRLDSATTKLLSMDINLASNKYEHFVYNTYHSPEMLTSYVKALHEFALREKEKVTARYNKRAEALLWVVVEKDSVPVLPTIHTRHYYPLLTEHENYVIGLYSADTMSYQGYFYSITPSRKPDIKIRFPLNKENFNNRVRSSIHALSCNSNNQVYYVLIYSEAKVKDKVPATIAKIYRSDGLAWSTPYPLNFVPQSITYEQDNGELTIQDGLGQVLVLDKNGKVVK